MQEHIALLTAALARGTPPAFTPEQLQEPRDSVTAGAAEDAPSPPVHPPHHGAGAGAAEGTMAFGRGCAKKNTATALSSYIISYKKSRL